MDKLEIIVFEPDHLTRMQPRSFEAAEMVLIGNPLERAAQYLQCGPAFTGKIGNEILACAGLLKLWEGVAEAWVVTTPLVTSKPLSFHRAISHSLRELTASMGLWRVQAAIRYDHAVSIRWATKLGLRYEGDMVGYGPDRSTYQRYAKIWLS
jgi:hypothetical protein